jgi:hypothetical protein
MRRGSGNPSTLSEPALVPIFPDDLRWDRPGPPRWETGD